MRCKISLLKKILERRLHSKTRKINTITAESSWSCYKWNESADEYWTFSCSWCARNTWHPETGNSKITVRGLKKMPIKEVEASSKQ